MAEISLNGHCIFDNEAFEQQLADSPDQLLPLLKGAIQQGQQAIRDAFEAGADTLQTVNTRALLIDHILQHAYKACFSDCKQPLALLAVGGYGRRELHPASDIDLMLLLDSEPDEDSREQLERFVSLLWDSRLEIGHSVRTLEQCVEEAGNDITVITNLMEARLLCGETSLFEQMQDATDTDKIWPSKAFFEAKLEEQTLRYHKFGDTAYNLEPNIKENPGGLRDLQMIGWVAKRHFGTRILRELVDHQFLSQAEYETLRECQIYLWKIRIHLHYLTGKHEDRMLFDLQKQLALAFGYEDSDNNLAIEQFMQRYYRVVMELERLNELLLQLFRQEILYSELEEEPSIINRRFHVQNGYIAASHENVFRKHPGALLEIFLIMELQPEIRGVHAHTIRLIRENTHLIDDHFRASRSSQQLFMDIINQPRGVTHELRRMNRYGILAAYIPAFGQIVGRMQYDLFHAYTVDQHTLFVVRNMRRLSVPDFAHEHPLASGIFHHLKKPKLLYLAGLFHDIAKGRGGNHAELGAVDALHFCQAHRLAEQDGQLVSWLVEKHLLMSMVAQRKDISDPEIIYNFAREIGTLERLDYLYLLTMCDIRATNPKQWTSWKDNLLSELYHKTASTLRAGLDNPQQRHIVAQATRTSASRMLTRLGVVTELLTDFWDNFSEDYFINHTPDEVTWHSQILLNNQFEPPIIRARTNQRGEAEIFIYCADTQKLFARIASTLEQLGLNIADARLNKTNNNFTLNSFKVLEDDGRSPSDGFRMNEIVEKLQSRLSHDDDIRPSPRRQNRALKSFDVETIIRFEQQVGNDLTIFNIETNDRPGLLASIAQGFADCDIHIHHAKISTAGEKAIDSFYITDRDYNPLLDDESMEELKAAVLNRLKQ